MKCIRCHEEFGVKPNGEKRDRCQNCGVGKDRPVRKVRRRGPIKTKRGRNSGVTNKSKQKGGTKK